MIEDGENKPLDYVVIRVTAVKVKRRFRFFWTEKRLGGSSAIADNHRKSAELYERIRKLMSEYGKTLKVE